MDRNVWLVSQYREGNENALETLVRENERLVWSIVNRMPTGICEKEDMFQTGCIGLVKAAQRFDIEKGVVFSTYAVYMIMGEIKKFLRDDGIIKVSRGLKELGLKVKKTATEIFTQSGREASVAEIAKKIGKSEEEVVECLEAGRIPISINKTVGDGEAELGDIIADNSEFDEKIVNYVSLSSATDKLKGRDKLQ